MQTSHLSTATPHTVATHGQLRGKGHQRTSSSAGASGEQHECLFILMTGQHFHSYSVLPALSLDGIVALDIVEGSYNTKRFKRFIRGLLDQMNEFPGPRSVVVLDNCRIHKSKAITDMIYER